MSQKLKIIIAVSIAAIALIIGIVIYNNSATDGKSPATGADTAGKVQAPAVMNISGDKEVDKSVNDIIDSALEDDLDSDFANAAAPLSEDEEVNQINNLFNEDEL